MLFWRRRSLLGEEASGSRRRPRLAGGGLLFATRGAPEVDTEARPGGVFFADAEQPPRLGVSGQRSAFGGRSLILHWSRRSVGSGGSRWWIVIEAVVFDVDGVLVRSGQFGQRLRREMGVDADELARFWRGPFVQCSLGLSDLKQEMAPFLARWGYRGTVEDCLRDWFEADSTVNGQVLEEVQRLRRRGVPCHVASTQEVYRASYLESAMGLGAQFDRLFFSCRLGSRKPELEFYRRVASELGSSPSALLFIDDQQMNVDGARAAGWSAERYAFGDDLSALLARYGILAQRGG